MTALVYLVAAAVAAAATLVVDAVADESGQVELWVPIMWAAVCVLAAIGIAKLIVELAGRAR
jgi:hypothetical protein